MAFTAITPTAVAVGAPLNNALMDLIRTNFDHFNGLVTQSVTTTASPTFADLTLTGKLSVGSALTGTDEAYFSAGFKHSTAKSMFIYNDADGCGIATKKTGTTFGTMLYMNDSATKSMSFYVDGSNKMSIDSSGLLTVGASVNTRTTPQLFFQEYTSTAISPVVEMNWVSAGAAYYGVRGAGGVGYHSWGKYAGAVATEYMSLSDSGNLSVAGTISVATDVTAGGTIKIKNDAAKAFYFYNNANTVQGSILQQGNKIYLAAGANYTVGLNMDTGGIIYMPQVWANTTTGTTNAMIMAADGSIYRSTGSSARYKENINTYNVDALAKVLALRPVTHQYKISHCKDRREILGFIAEEVNEIEPLLVDLTEIDGEIVPDSVRYAHITALLTKAIQELNARLEALEGKTA